MPVDAKTRITRAAKYARRIERAEALVPPGPYCYGRLDIVRAANGAQRPRIEPDACPYWRRRGDKPFQISGYCRLLKRGDHTQGRDARGAPRSTLALFDMVKACNLNLDETNDDGAAAQTPPR